MKTHEEERGVIYVCGPYRASTENEVWLNIENARRATAELFRAGWMVLCPHSNTFMLGGVVPDEVFLQGDLTLIRRCADALYMLEGWHRSEGAKREYDLATKLDIPVYFQEPNSPPPLCSVSKTRIWL